jgi:predicted dehydrogenase
LLSTARINRALIPPLQRSKRNQLWGIASRSLERAQDYAREWEIPHAYGSYDEMLADSRIDVIYNPLPNSMHAEWTIRAMQAGKHVLCEKPLAISLEQVDEMRATAHQTGKVLTEAFMYRHHPQTIQVKELANSGILGDLRLIRGVFRFQLNQPNDIRLVPEFAGGSIWDIGCYPISYARYIYNAEPQQVFGIQSSSSSRVDMSFSGLLNFPGDKIALFDSSFQLPFRAEIELVGTDASLLIPNPYKPGRSEKIYLYRGGEIETIKIQGTDLYQGEVEDLADAALNGKPPRISLSDSRGNIATILSLLEAARSGIPQTTGAF